jgi:hypothetical protein
MSAVSLESRSTLEAIDRGLGTEAMTKATDLPEAAQELSGRVESLSRLRADIALGPAELDAGKGEELDIEDGLRQVREEHGRSVP